MFGLLTVNCLCPQDTDGTRDEAKLRWPHRRLTKGEPSGSAEGEATTTTRQPAAAAGARLGAGDDEAERSVLTRLVRDGGGLYHTVQQLLASLRHPHCCCRNYTVIGRP